MLQELVKCRQSLLKAEEVLNTRERNARSTTSPTMCVACSAWA